MNYRYVKKPVIVEAFQMTQERRQNNSEWPQWLHRAWNKEPGEGSMWPVNYPKSDGKDRLCIGTKEGVHMVSWNDFIIQGVQGELYPCKPNIFWMTYEEA